jgi:hypothetical protein
MGRFKALFRKKGIKKQPGCLGVSTIAVHLRNFLVRKSFNRRGLRDFSLRTQSIDIQKIFYFPLLLKEGWPGQPSNKQHKI